MHSAPAVSYPVGRSRFQGQLLVAIAAVGASLMMLWTVQAAVLQARHLIAVMVWLGSVGLAAWHWWRTPTGALAWDGQSWLWSTQTQSCAVLPTVALDTQGSLLLWLHQQEGKTIWAWPQQSTVPQRWLSFRRAVFGRPPPAADSGDDAPPVHAGSTGAAP